MNAANLCLLAAGLLFMTGLLTGLWKYSCIALTRNTTASAPVYVDIAHRASLMYSFSAILLREFVPYSPLSATGTLWAVGVPLLFFFSAIATYVLHGLLKDTENQLKAPYTLGRNRLPGFLIHGFMAALAIGEIGGFAILLYGAIHALA